jgi:hypothetical protein
MRLTAHRIIFGISNTCFYLNKPVKIVLHCRMRITSQKFHHSQYSLSSQYSRIHCTRPEPLFFFFKQLLNCPHEAEWTPFQTLYFSENLSQKHWPLEYSGDQHTSQPWKIHRLQFTNNCIIFRVNVLSFRHCFLGTLANMFKVWIPNMSMWIYLTLSLIFCHKLILVFFIWYNIWLSTESNSSVKLCLRNTA